MGSGGIKKYWRQATWEISWHEMFQEGRRWENDCLRNVKGDIGWWTGLKRCRGITKCPVGRATGSCERARWPKAGALYITDGTFNKNRREKINYSGNVCHQTYIFSISSLVVSSRPSPNWFVRIAVSFSLIPTPKHSFHVSCPSTLKRVATHSFETIYAYKTTRCHVPEYYISVQIHYLGVFTFLFCLFAYFNTPHQI